MNAVDERLLRPDSRQTSWLGKFCLTRKVNLTDTSDKAAAPSLPPLVLPAMAITHVEFTLFSALRQTGQLPPRPQILELGKNNWYGDVPASQLGQAIYELVEDKEQRKSLLLELDRLAADDDEPSLYALSELFLRVFTDYSSLASNDPGLPHSTYKFDLNQPIPLRRQFDLVINSGTAEHVFNIGQFFKTAHDLTAPGGLMLHGSPFTGWLDNGFYNLQPTLFWDLAHANDYEMLVMVYAEFGIARVIQLRTRQDVQQLRSEGRLAENSLLYAVLRKRNASEFCMPIQGCYANQLSFEAIPA